MTHAVYQRAEEFFRRPARNQYTIKQVEEHIVRNLIRDNIIVFVMILYYLFMASLKLWTIW